MRRQGAAAAREAVRPSVVSTVTRLAAAGAAAREAAREAARRARLASVVAAAAVVIAAISPVGLGAQADVATAPVEVEHWAYAALDRLTAAGLLGDEWEVGRRPQPAGVMMEAFRAARRHARERTSPLAEFARAGAERFGGEFPQLRAYGGGGSERTTTRRLTTRVGGFGGDTESERSLESLEVGFDLSASLDRHLAIRYGSAVKVGLLDGEPSLGPSSVAIVGRLGGWWASAGRQRVSFGPGTGGLVLDGGASFNGLLVGTGEPIRLGGIGSLLGPLRASALVSRLPADTLGSAAWFGAMRVTLAPHSRLQIGFNRTMVVATRVDGHEPSFTDLLFIAAGKHTQPNFEDQRASVDVSARIGTGSWRLAPYVEWGIEDTAGAFLEDPALSAGAFVPHLPGLPQLSMRYEYTAFGDAARLCGFCDEQRRNWYRHSGVRSAYVADGGRLIGHSLGGYGYEHRVETAAWLGGTRARLEATLVSRAREPGNLLYANRPGRSRGAGLRAIYRLGRSATLDGNVWWEGGEEGWTDSAAWIGARILF